MKPCILAALGMSAGLLAADLPKAETLLERYVEVTGGRSNYEKRTTEYVSGVVEISAQGVKGKVEMWAQAPNSRVEIIEIDGIGRMETGTDGVIAWENSAIMGPRLRAGAELRYHLHEAVFNGPIHWRELYKEAKTVGIEKVGNDDCYKLLMTPTEGKPESWFVDVKTNYIVKMIRTAITTMGEVNGEYLMKDYKNSDGILMPQTLIQRAAEQEIVVRFQTITPNVKIPKDRFTPPAEVKQLMVPKKEG